VTRTLGIEGPYLLTRLGRKLWPRYVIPGSDPISVLIRVFLLSLPEPASSLRELFGEVTVALLQELRLLDAEEPPTLRSPIALYPVGPLYIATDWWFERKGSPAANGSRVMPLGRDSYGLARAIASFSGNTAVDLCSGSGVGAIKAAMTFDRVLGVDVNPRAVNFARFNAILNGVNNCSFEQADLYEAVGTERFDLITANPPFVPVPGRTRLLYRDGGASGEDVLRQVIAGCADHLSDKGMCLIVTDLVEHRGTKYEQKLAQWLGVDSGFTAAVLKRPAETIYQYVSSHLSHTAPFGISPDLFEWIDHYRAEGIEEVARGYIAIQRRTQSGIRTMIMPIERAFSRDVASGFVEEILRRVDVACSHHFPEFRFSPRFNPADVRLLPDGPQVTDVTLPYFLVNRMEAAASEGAISVDALVAVFNTVGYSVGPQRRQELEHVLRQLYVCGHVDSLTSSATHSTSTGRGRREIAMKMWWSQ
jgi:methylase of polypeptide subunit release factors